MVEVVSQRVCVGHQEVTQAVKIDRSSKRILIRALLILPHKVLGEGKDGTQKILPHLLNRASLDPGGLVEVRVVRESKT